MNPQAPLPAPPPITPHSPGHDPYAFITNPGKPPKKSLIPSGNSTSQRIMIVGAGAVVLIIVATVLISIITSAGKGNTESLVLAAQQQQELIRIADLGTQKAKGSTAKNLATTAKLTLTSDQVELQTIVKKTTKLDNKILLAGKDPKTDELLTSAEQINRFDETFTELMQKELGEYQATLKKAYDGSTSESSKEELANQFKNAGLLLGVEE